mgnify:CR=1 FL=1
MMEKYEGLFTKYQDSRSLTKLKTYALWTVPSAFPETEADTDSIGNTPIEHDYQSIGAVLVNFLAAKLAGLLFPVTQSFFKIKPTEVLKGIAKNVFAVDDDTVKNELIQLENDAAAALFKNASYAQLIQMMRYLIITGNCLFKRINGKMTVYSLRNYAQLRDNEGTVLDVILKENWAWSSLPPVTRSIIGLPQDTPDDKNIPVFTRIQRKLIKGHVNYEVSQQSGGVSLGPSSLYPENLCPYNIVVWNMVNGDSNGRGLVEDHAGDFAKLSDLSRALAVYEINACRVVNLVKPGSTVDIDYLNDSAGVGEFVQGDPANIQALESGDAAKIQQISASLDAIFQRLALAFMYQGNTRDAERVTAEELQMNARETEAALGGVYSQLSQTIHIPLSYQLCQEVNPAFITAVIAGEVELEVITGLPALGRSTVVTQLLQAVQEIGVIIQTVAAVSQRFDKEKIIDLILQARGINLEDVMLSKEALKAQEEQLQAEQAAQAGMGMGGQPAPTEDITSIL